MIDTRNDSTPEQDADLLAPPERALALVGDARDGGVALVDGWVRRGNVAAVAVIADEGNGPARKAARRGLNVLKSKGILPTPRAHVVRMTASDAVIGEEAHLLAPDSSGSVLVAIAQRKSSGRTTAAYVILNDSAGVLRIENDELAHSRFLERLERALPGAGYRPVPVPVAWARWRVKTALEEQARRGAPAPLGLMTARPLLEPAPSEAPEHPLDSEGLVLAAEDALELAKGSARLHDLPELRGWLPPQQLVDAMLLEVGKTLEPNAEPPEGHIERELARQVEAATDRYFSPQVRERLVVLLKDATLSVLNRVGEQAALDVVATIHAVQNAGLITDPPHEVPFLRAFFEKAIALLVAQNKGQLRIPVPQRAARAAEGPAGEQGNAPSDEAASPTSGADPAEPDAPPAQGAG